MSFAVTCVCVSYNAEVYIVLIDWCAVNDSLGGTLHMSMCVISTCKSAIVSLYTPALWGTQNSPVLNLVHVLVVRICSEYDCILHVYLYSSDGAVTMMIPG